MKRFLKHSRAGFTMMEMIVVIAIIGVLAAIAVPSVLGFIEYGKQTSRSNVARTLYLAAQNRLTELRITRKLESEITGEYFTINADGNYIENKTALETIKNVYNIVTMPAEEQDKNRNYVHYISKARGVTDPNDPVIKLLDPVIIDKTVLYDAILIEFNVKTGVVLSVFYSDAIADGEWLDYYDNGSLRDIVGGRPYDPAIADERKQGYYGVDQTGNLQDFDVTLINVYDSYTRPLPDDSLLLGQNSLYAEILIPTSQANAFDLYIDDKPVANKSNVILYDGYDSVDPDEGLMPGYSCYIWVLDYVGGDTTTLTAFQSIKYYDTAYAAFTGKTNIHVGISGTAASATSFTEAHPYYLTQPNKEYNGDKYSIMSARHLYNIRYMSNLSNATFTQKANIDLLEHNVLNFKPIPTFTGKYNGTGYLLKNLNVNIPDGNAGLFGEISGGTVEGLTLDNPSISSDSGNVGSVAGTLSSGIVTGTYVRFNDTSASAASITSITNIGNVGGIIGEITGGTLADTTFISDSSICNISGGSSTGGIAGSNSGTLTRALFLALAPTNSEDKICPIVGTGTGSNAYYLRGTSKRPKMPAADPDDEPVGIPYNMEEPSNDIGSPCDTAELYNKFWESGSAVLNTNWEIMDGLNETNVNDGTVIREDNLIYPYPIYKFSKSQVAGYPNWPIVIGGDIVIDNVYYYEKYSNDTCGVWSVDGGIDTLKDADDASDIREITEAGYMVIMDEEPAADTPIHFFVKNTTDTSWHRITDRNIDPNPGLVFEIDSPLAAAAGRTPFEAWVAVLDIADLIVEAKQAAPLQMMYSTDENGINNLNLMETYIQPLFAKGLYNSATGSTTHYIRTPWQMRNISSLTSANIISTTIGGITTVTSNDTTGKTFVQELDLNFSDPGIGVLPYNSSWRPVTTLDVSVVTGTFQGTYRSSATDNRVIRNINIFLTSASNAGLFEQNRGTIENINIDNASILNASGNGSNFGFIASINNGNIRNITMTSSNIILGADNTGSVAGTNTGTITNVNLQNSGVNGANNIGGIAGTNSGTINTVNLQNASVAGTNNVGGVAGTNEVTGEIDDVTISYTDMARVIRGTLDNVGGIAGTNAGTINNVNLQDPNVTGADDIGGVAGTNGTTGGITGATVSYADMTRTISGTGSNVGGIAGNNTGAITTVNLQDASVEGCNYIGGVAGTNGNGGRITGANVIFTNENREIKGVVANSAGIGGIAGQNSDRITDSVFISTTAKVHISGIDYVGGIAGTNSANINQVLFLARAPINAAGNTIYPIIGNGTAATNSFYLYGVAVRPNTDTTGNNFNFNVETVSGGGTPLTTLQMHQMDISGWTGTNWNRNPIDNATVNVPIGNVGYPYPMSNNRWVDNWPITHIPPIATANIVYYEIYTNDTYGMWSLARDRLSTNQIVREAGYAVLSQGNMSGTHSFFAENPATGNWQLINTLNFSNTSQLANAARTLGFQTGTDSVFAAQLDLNALAGVMVGSNNPNNPLRIMHTLSNALNTPTNPVIIQGYLHPLFAKGLYNNPTVPAVTAFSVRTAWQMRNISALTAVTPNLTSGRTFTQELDLDFGRTGAGVSNATATVAVLTNAAVTGNFAGTYNGGNRVVDRLAINENVNNDVGLFAINSGTITNITVRNAAIMGVNNVGAIAGTNNGSVALSGVQQSRVTGSATSDANVGGVVGNNSGTVADVFFLSTADITDPPVSNNGGGIVGSNNGTVDRALYLAPAPKSSNIDVKDGKVITTTTIFPIIRSGIEAGKADNDNDTCFYLAGGKYHLGKNAAWISIPYNRDRFGDEENLVNIAGGGTRLITRIFDMDWFNSKYGVKFDNWEQTPNYPYPIIKNMPLPEDWTTTDSPTRLGQEDRDNWGKVELTSNRAANVGFVNGSFTDGNFNSLPIAELVDETGEKRRMYVDMQHVNGWYTRPVKASVFNTIYAGNLGNPTPSWRLIELQEPTNVANQSNLHQYAYSNYQGNWNRTRTIRNSPYRYAELNAEVQGTLYQVCATTPSRPQTEETEEIISQFYYSFYHTSRTGGANQTIKDDMNFYLSSIADGTKTVVENATELTARDSAMTLIRPCRSPRTSNNNVNGTDTSPKPAANATAWNTLAWETVSYGASFDLNYHRGKSYTQLDGTSKVQNIPRTGNVYLYDVWVGSTSGNTRSGYGITFWSTDSEITTGNNGGNKIIPTAGITQAQLSNSWSWLADAKTNVIGYWDISYGWKHYYGLYTVPEGQRSTEFAYQSRRDDANNGNYLDGISFKSPAFLSIDKFIKMEDTDGKLTDVKFVTLGDIMTVELNVTSWGEVPADNIVIKDQFAPFDAYVEYDMNSVRVTKNNTNVRANVTIGADNTLTISLPDTTLAKDETVKVTFNIQVRDRVIDENGNETENDTLLYYLKNQALVEYCDPTFAAYKNVVKTNYSEVLQVFIDPVKLEKTVKTVGVNGDDPLVGVNGTEFDIKLTVKNNIETGSSFTTTGIITDVIPKDFIISEYGNLPKDRTTYTRNRDGTMRITISGVNLGENGTTEIPFNYRIKYDGDAYGVSYTNVSADYKYEYISDTETLDVVLEFPQPVVGIKVETENVAFPVHGSGTQVLDITRDFDNRERLTSANYDIMYEVILCNANGTPVSKNGDGLYQITESAFTAFLNGTNYLEFTPNPGYNGEYTLYYKIRLIAKKEGATPPEFDLSSDITKVTVRVTGMGDSLVYYEQYDVNDYGFHYGYTSSDNFDETGAETIIDSGYGVVSTTSGSKDIQIDGKMKSISSEIVSGMNLYKLEVATSSSLDLVEIKLGNSSLGYFHPNFAKAVYFDNTATPAYFSIRTPEQMMNIGELDDTDGITFTQERDLDFGYKSTMTSVIVSGEFMGTYDGGARVDEDGERVIGKTIKNVKIVSSATNTGLFSQNSGTIKGVTLQGSQDNDIKIIGTDNVGGIAGWNNGVIENCVVEGDNDGYGVHIEGVNNVGGIAGWNNGAINNCTVKNTKHTIIGYDFVGGITGFNGGEITNVIVETVTLEHVGTNFGDIVGGGNSVIGSTNMNVATLQIFTEADDELENSEGEEEPLIDEPLDIEQGEDEILEPDEELEQAEEEAPMPEEESPTPEEEVYEITVDGDDLIDVEVTVDGEDATQAAEGDPVTVTVYPTSNMGFDIQVAVDEQFGIVEIIDEITDDNIFEFIMPNSPVTIYIIPTLPQEGAAGEETDVDESGNSNGSGEESGNEESNADNNNDEENGNNSDAVIDGNNSGDGGDIVNNEQTPGNGEANDPNQDGIMQFLPLDTMAMAGFPIFALRRRKKFSFLKRGGRDAKTKTRNKG